MIGSQTSGTAIDEYSLVVVLGMETLSLLQHYQGGSGSDRNYERYKPCHETENDIHHDEPDNRASGCCCSPVDVAALESHQFEGPLQPLEHGIGRIAFFTGIRHCLHTEEERQSLGSCDKEDAGADNHHDRLLHILLLVVHLDIDADCAHDGDNAGDGVAELDDDGDILGDFLRYGGQRGGARLVVACCVLGEHCHGADNHHHAEHLHALASEEAFEFVCDFFNHKIW